MCRGRRVRMRQAIGAMSANPGDEDAEASQQLEEASEGLFHTGAVQGSTALPTL